MIRGKLAGMTIGDVALLALRLMIAGEFLPSGWLSARDPAGRGKGEGLSPAFMLFIGVAEVAGSLGLVFGVLARWAAAGLMVIGVGAMYKKVFVWHSGYWGKDGYGTHYDLMLFVMNFVVVAVGAGRLSLLG